MNGITERLRFRLAAGLVTDLQMPNYETKIAILNKKVANNGEQVPLDVINFLASCSIANIRELEGLLVRIFAFASLTKQPITLNLAMSVLSQTHYAKDENIVQTDFNRILKCISKFYKYNIDDLCSKGRNKELVLARQIAMFLMRKMTNKSLRDIGKFLGSRNHATIKHGLLKIEEQVNKDQDFLAHIRQIQQEVLNM
jgi:chromosomal replication initiator protein